MIRRQFLRFLGIGTGGAVLLRSAVSNALPIEEDPYKPITEDDVVFTLEPHNRMQGRYKLPFGRLLDYKDNNGVSRQSDSIGVVKSMRRETIVRWGQSDFTLTKEDYVKCEIVKDLNTWRIQTRNFKQQHEDRSLTGDTYLDSSQTPSRLVKVGNV